mmetsp:Transcript_35799/g.57572  ORF Transcript_35799/g.57572 Transcript_35799/m.57572 type:complete len:216 (-) Transcript_35799:275-922(-)
MSMMLHIMLKTSVASIIRILQLNQKDFSSSISTRFASSTATCFSAILCATSARATLICATTRSARAARSVPPCSAYSAVTRSRPAVTASGSCTLPVAATATAVTTVAATTIVAAEALSVVPVASSAAASPHRPGGDTPAAVVPAVDGAVSSAAKKLGLYLPFRRMCRGLRTTTSAETLATCGDSSSSAAAGGGRASSIESSSICFSSTSSSSSSC